MPAQARDTPICLAGVKAPTAFLELLNDRMLSAIPHGPRGHPYVDAASGRDAAISVPASTDI